MTITSEPTRTNETINVTVVAGPTSRGTVADWELFFARRALAKLKSRLAQKGLLDLLAPDIDASTQALKTWVDSSQGQWRPATTQLQSRGISAEEFLSYFMSILSDQPKNLAVQPEHFVLTPVEDGEGHLVRVVENLSRYISDFYITFTGEDQAVVNLAPEYPIRMVGTVALADGTTIGHCLHQFRETEDGFDALLAIYFPAAAPEEFIEGHRQHLAVEFTNWIIGAAESLNRTGNSPVPLVVTGTEKYRS
jgi:uncharacterized protein